MSVVGQYHEEEEQGEEAIGSEKDTRQVVSLCKRAMVTYGR
jgi:hypothetical protein